MLVQYPSMTVLTPQLFVFGAISIFLIKLALTLISQRKLQPTNNVEEADLIPKNLLRTVAQGDSTPSNYQSFQHKASGRSVIFSLGNGHILKQCIREEEILFYKNVAPELQPILPRCCAVLQNQTTSRLDNYCRLCNSSLLNVPKGITGSWLVLEDLTNGFNAPCILDLKLGTRTHPDSADPQTAVRKREKCLRTTSSRLGLRFEGMRIPNTKDDILHVHKKQDPRLTFTMEEPLKMCTLFFTNVKQWVNILQQLRHIKQVVGKLDGYRFYASSLLIITETGGQKATVRLVDFAKTTIPGVVGNHHSGPDRGCLKGLETLENLIVSMPNKSETTF